MAVVVGLPSHRPFVERGLHAGFHSLIQYIRDSGTNEVGPKASDRAARGSDMEIAGGTQQAASNFLIPEKQHHANDADSLYGALTLETSYQCKQAFMSSVQTWNPEAAPRCAR